MNNKKKSGDLILSIKDLSKSFGGLKAVDRFRLDQQEGELKGLIGPNGAGKTTVFNLITGFYSPDQGQIIYKGKEIAGKSPDKIVERNLARTFQEVRMMKNVKVIESLKTAYFRHVDYNIFDIIFNTNRYATLEDELEKKCYDNLELFGIANLGQSLASDLSYGDQRRVSIARALTLDPELLLLDEPTAGLNPNETDVLIDQVLKIKKEMDISILLVEHDMRVVMNVCDTIVAMSQGQVIGQGTPQEVQENEKVAEAYLGSDINV